MAPLIMVSCSMSITPAAYAAAAAADRDPGKQVHGVVPATLGSGVTPWVEQDRLHLIEVLRRDDRLPGAWAGDFVVIAPEIGIPRPQDHVLDAGISPWLAAAA